MKSLYRSVSLARPDLLREYFPGAAGRIPRASIAPETAQVTGR